MKVVVKYFAGFKESAGTESEEMEMEEGATIGQLVEMVTKMHPDLEGAANIALISVNLEFVDRDRKVADGDEIGILPPVSGG